MKTLYVQPAGASRWCKLDINRTTTASYTTICSARIDASEILFLALHPPGPVCSACKPPNTGDIFAGQITVVSKVRPDMMAVRDPADHDEYLAYQVIPGEQEEPKVVVDPDVEIEDACEAIREWGGV